MRLVLALISCLGFAPVSGAAIESLDAETLDVERPRFSIEGQTFFISTECSPHSLGVTLLLPPDQLEVTGTVDYVRSDKYRLNYSDMSITWINQTMGTGFHPVSSVVKAYQEQDPVAFKEQVLKMIGLVQRIEQGNICFPAKPEVREVVDYLKLLAS